MSDMVCPFASSAPIDDIEISAVSGKLGGGGQQTETTATIKVNSTGEFKCRTDKCPMWADLSEVEVVGDGMAKHLRDFANVNGGVCSIKLIPAMGLMLFSGKVDFKSFQS